MQDRYRTERYGADKIALFGLFVLSLLIAQFLTASRSAVGLSEPIGLSHAGLSVSMPSGKGWGTEEQWEYHENAFILSGVFLPVLPRPTVTVQCRYLLAAPQTGVDVRFQQKAGAVDGEIAETGRLQVGALTVHWAHIKELPTRHIIFFATAQLPNERQFEIELHEATGDTDLARRAFMGIAESLKFEDMSLLAAGGQVVARIKDKGLDKFLRPFEESSQNGVAVEGRGQRDFFLIEDASGQTIGFTMDVLAIPQQGPQAPNDLTISSVDIQLASFLYIRGRYPQEQVSIFKCENNLDEFFWKSEGRSLAGTTAAEITTQQAGVITVTWLSPKPRREDYHLGPAAIPDILFGQLLSQMLDDNREEIIADLIDAQGKIIPTLISRIKIDDAAGFGEAQFAFKLEFLDGRDFRETVYLDSQHQIKKRILHQQGLYILERTDVQTVLEQFPERAEYILQYSDGLGESL
jgi:hypothetical protein